MRIRMSAGRIVNAVVVEQGGEPTLLYDYTEVRAVGPGSQLVEHLEVVEANEAELDELLAAGFGKLPGLAELLKASNARLWRVMDAATGQELGTYRASTRSGAILACIDDGQGSGVDLQAVEVDG